MNSDTLAQAVYSAYLKSAVGSAKECRVNHIAQLEGKLKSAKEWLRKKSKCLKDSQKFYRAKNWQFKKSAPNLRLSCYLDSRQSTHQSIKFSIHHKKRYIAHIERRILSSKNASIRVTVNKHSEAYFVGSKGETCGNQIFQFNGSTVKLRVPPCLEEKYGETLECSIAPFPYGQDKLELVLSTTGFTQNKKTGQQSPIRYGLALTHRFYAQDFRWFWAITVNLPSVKRITRPRQYGCIGIDTADFSLMKYSGNL